VSELYMLRFVGNFTLAPVAMIILSFYQDWVPIAVACALTLVLVFLAWADPSYYDGTRGFAVELPHTGMTLRGAAIIVAAGLALAVWRSGTQVARDQLTGGLSRAGAERALDHELSRGHRPAVWVCDIDNFAAVNEYLGPEVGDRMLKQVAHRLEGVARSQPGGWLCARLGADTFMIAGRHVPDETFVTAFAHGLEAEAGLRADMIGDDGVPISFSVGAATAIDGERGSGLIRAAERNMRDAKGRGSRRVVVDRRIDRAVEYTDALLTGALYAACDRGELEVFLQPVVRLSDGEPIGAEGLVRWNHPTGGLMLPGEFLPEARKESALMAVVSQTMSMEFLRIVADLSHRHGTDWLSHGYAFNLAPIRLRDPSLIESLEQQVKAAGVAKDAGLLQIEITEGALMEVESDAPAVLADLAARGYRIALDDFGTGHSSLEHLRDFPLDTVKIDKSFVRAMGRSPTDRAVVQAATDIASAAGLKVVAEGVETEEQRELLLAISPDILAQGWLYAKAMSASDFEQWVLGRKQALAVDGGPRVER
jgi:diguanylate cyclase